MAQSISLPGSVVIQNSEYATGHRQYVSDASIRAPFAKAVSSDKDGQFSLAFAGVESGTPVRLTVSKPGFEVVNSKETEQVILGRQQRLQVVMADAQKLAEAQVSYYHIATESITRSFERKMAALRSENTALSDRLATVGREMNDTLRTLGDAMTALSQQRDAGIEQARDLAKRFAEVNLDDASALYRQAFAIFQRGQLDSVVILLNHDRLEHAYEKASAELKRIASAEQQARENMRQLYQSFRLKADVLRTSLDYHASLAVLERMKEILVSSTDVFDPVETVRVMREIGEMKYRMGSITEALHLFQQALDTAARLLPSDHLELGYLHGDIGETFWENGQLDSALAQQTIALDLQEKALGDEDGNVAGVLHDISVIHERMGDHKKALEFAERALAMVRKARGPEDPYTGIACTGTGMLHAQLGELEKADELVQQGLAIMLKVLPPNDPYLAGAYSKVGLVAYYRGDFAGTLDANRKALSACGSTLGRDHPTVGDLHYNIAAALGQLGAPDSALQEYHEALRIRLISFGRQDARVASTYTGMGNAQLSQGKILDAKAGFDAALEIQKNLFGSDDPRLWNTLTSLAAVFDRLGMPDSARYCYDRALEMLTRIQGPGHPMVGMLYSRIGTHDQDQGEHVRAIELFRKSLAIAVKASGGENALVADRHALIGMAYYSQRELDSAGAHLDTALAICHRFPNGNDALLARIDAGLALVMVARGEELDPALTLARTGRKLLEKSAGADPSKLVPAISACGQVLEAQKKYDDALEEYRSALNAALGSQAPNARDASRMRFYIGRTLYEKGDAAHALTALDSSMLAYPNGDAAWYRYRIFSDRGDGTGALERLIECARLRIAWPGTLSRERQETLDALKVLATKQERQDVLEEFHLN